MADPQVRGCLAQAGSPVVVVNGALEIVQKPLLFGGQFFLHGVTLHRLGLYFFYYRPENVNVKVNLCKYHVNLIFFDPEP
jgi:hypothetical protein